MLLFSTAKSITVDGVTVFPDSADPNQFWYLPGPVSLAHRVDGQASFTFIKYKPAAVESGVKGGGFVMFSTCLKLDPATEGRIKGQLSAMAPGDPVLNLAQFDSGTVKCVALNLQGSGGTSASAAAADSFNAVEEILGANTPSLQGDEEAAFSLTLSQEGAIILEQAYKQGTGPIGVIYDLKFTGLRPSLDVKITADYKRMYDGLSVDLSAQYYFVKADLQAAFEKMVQDGTIKVEVTNFTSDQDAKDKEKWALDFFTEKLLADWFEPTLSLGQPKVDASSGGGGLLGAVGNVISQAAGSGSSSGSTSSPSRPATAGSGSASTTGSASSSSSTTTPRPSSSPSTGSSTPSASASSSSSTTASASQAAPTSIASATAPAAATGSGTGSGSASSTGSGTGNSGSNATSAGTGTTPAPVTHAPAALTQTPNPPPSGYGMQHTPATSGTTETITVLVGNSTPTVTVDGRAATLNASHQLTMDVAPGSQHEIRLEYPAAGQQASETFNLNFQFDLPKESGFTVNPPSDAYKAYLTNTANDAPFRRSQAPSGTSSSRGAQALRDWINSLPDPKTVQLDAHASWEGFTDTAHSQYNLSLSNRRLQVAMGIIGEHAHVSASGFTGDSDAQTAGRRSTAGGTADNPDRVVHIKGLTGAAPSATVVTGRISRPADPARPSTPTTPATPSTPTTPKTPTTPATPSTPAKPSTPATPAQPAGSGQIAGNPAISFKLKFVHQEELKTMTFEYNRSDATQRSYAPQGFFGLMLADLKDEEKSFLEVDLDDPFFREFAVTVQAPIDFQKIGLRSAHVSLDYGDPNDAQNFKHGDAIFDPTQPNEYKFAVFMDANHDTGYSYSTEYHFDPESGWDGNSFSYQFQPRQTEDRTLFLNPYDQIGFLEVQVFPHQVDPGVMDSIDVNLSHTDPDGQVVRRTLNVTPGSQPQFWRVRLADPQAHTYTCQLTHHLKDGTQIKADPVDSTATALPVNDPFDKAIEIDFVPVFNSATTRLVFIDVTYDDDKNNYHRQERLELQPNNQNPTHLRIALMDPARTTFSYRITIVGTAGQMNQGKFIETGETLIPVSAPATDAP